MSSETERQNQQERTRLKTFRARVDSKKEEDKVREKLEEAGMDSMAVDGAAEQILNKWVQDGYRDMHKKVRNAEGKLVSLEDANEVKLEERKAQRQALQSGGDWDEHWSTSLEESKQKRVEENRRRKRIGLPSLEELDERHSQMIMGALKAENGEEEEDGREAAKWSTKDLSVMYKRRDAKGRMARAGSFRPPGHTESEASCTESEEETARPAASKVTGVDGMWARGATLPDEQSGARRRGPSPKRDKRSASPKSKPSKSKRKAESSDSSSSDDAKKKKKKAGKKSKGSKKSKRKKSKKSKRAKSSSDSSDSD